MSQSFSKQWVFRVMACIQRITDILLHAREHGTRHGFGEDLYSGRKPLTAIAFLPVMSYYYRVDVIGSERTESKPLLFIYKKSIPENDMHSCPPPLLTWLFVIDKKKMLPP